MRKGASTSHGVTIIEMMVALAVSALLLGGAWQIFQGGMRSYHRGLQEVRMTQAARAFLRLVTRDVQRAMAAHVPYGIRGVSQVPSGSLATGRQTDRLAILTIPTLAAPRGQTASNREPQRIRYVLSALPEGKTLTLQRAVETGDQQTARLMLLHDQVQEFSVRYFDGHTWSDEWQQAELPRALEITVVVQSVGELARASRFATLVTAD